MMVEKIVVVFDSFSVRAEAVKHAIELAKRTNASIFFLVILDTNSRDFHSDPESFAREIKKRTQEAIVQHMNAARQSGIDAETEVRVGDPSSEFIKFLANFKKIKSVIWGGSADIANKAQHRNHWLTKMKDLLKCPIIVPTSKAQ